MHEPLYENGPFGFFAFSDSGILITLNETATAELKYTRDQLQGSDVEKIFTLPTRIFYHTHFFPLVKMHGNAEEIFISLRCSDGEQLPVLLNARRMQWEEDTITCCAFVVVRNRKKFEDELVAARKTAEKALNENIELLRVKSELQEHASALDRRVQQVNRQNEELQQFSHVITHSLKEPLRKLLMFSTMLEGRPDDVNLSRMLRSAQQLSSIVAALQQYVWLNEKKNNFSEVDLNVIVAGAAKQIREESGSEVLNLKYGHLESVQGHADQLQLMMYHILANSVQFKKHETAGVTITTVIIKQNKFRNVEDKYKYEAFVKIEITDDGIGFENEYNKQIFELFQKLHNNAGQGLGLALCKRIAENHDGFIEAESVKGAFTRIIVWLPLTKGK